MDCKIVTFDDIYPYIGMKQSFWDKAKGMDNAAIKREVRNNLFWPEGFLAQLKGLALDEQMKYYGISENTSYSKSSYGEIDSEKKSARTFPLSAYPGLRALIVEDAVLIGVCIGSFLQSGPWGTPVFPYQEICTYIGSDNDGSGTSDREDFAQLFCIKK